MTQCRFDPTDWAHFLGCRLALILRRPTARAYVLVPFTGLISVCYFAVGYSSLSIPNVLPMWFCQLATPFDSYVPFLPWFIILYLSLWLLWWTPIYRFSS